MVFPKYCSLLLVRRLELQIGTCKGVHTLIVHQTPVLVYVLPASIGLPLYLTSTSIPSFVNGTLHPDLHSFTIDNNESFAKSGITWQYCAAFGSCGRLGSSICVECT